MNIKCENGEWRLTFAPSEGGTFHLGGVDYVPPNSQESLVSSPSLADLVQQWQSLNPWQRLVPGHMLAELRDSAKWPDDVREGFEALRRIGDALGEP